MMDTKMDMKERYERKYGVIDEVKELQRDDMRLFEMANLTRRETGLDRDIWIMTNTEEPHKEPRLKVEFEKGNRLPVIISDDPYIPVGALQKFGKHIDSHVFQDVQEWIRLNRKILLTYWNHKGEMSTSTALLQLKRLGDSQIEQMILGEDETGLSHGFIRLSSALGEVSPQLRFYRGKPNRKALYSVIEIPRHSAGRAQVLHDDLTMTPDEIQEVLFFIQLNQELLLSYWIKGDEMPTMEVIKQLVRIM